MGYSPEVISYWEGGDGSLGVPLDEIVGWILPPSVTSDSALPNPQQQQKFPLSSHELTDSRIIDCTADIGDQRLLGFGGSPGLAV